MKNIKVIKTPLLNGKVETTYRCEICNAFLYHYGFALFHYGEAHAIKDRIELITSSRRFEFLYICTAEDMEEFWRSHCENDFVNHNNICDWFKGAGWYTIRNRGDYGYEYLSFIEDEITKYELMARDAIECTSLLKTLTNKKIIRT